VPKSRRSQEERSQATRAALVNAAHRLFAEHGYAAVSADEIVAAAGVTRREVLRKGATSYLEVPLLAISFLHCKNVGVSDVVPPPKLARAQERRYGIPKVTCKILDIRPMRRVLEEEGGMGRGPSSQQALHIVRGHCCPSSRRRPTLAGRRSRHTRLAPACLWTTSSALSHFRCSHPKSPVQPSSTWCRQIPSTSRRHTCSTALACGS
jgi:hypothetical protein